MAWLAAVVGRLRPRLDAKWAWLVSGWLLVALGFVERGRREAKAISH